MPFFFPKIKYAASHTFALRLLRFPHAVTTFPSRSPSPSSHLLSSPLAAKPLPNAVQRRSPSRRPDLTPPAPSPSPSSPPAAPFSSPSTTSSRAVVVQDTMGVDKSCTWIHSDIMDDNIHMELSFLTSCSAENSNSTNSDHSKQKSSWFANHILDFSDLCIGDPLLDLIPIYLDVFRGDSRLLKHFLERYKLPLIGRQKLNGVAADNSKCARLSYQAMCYCILHDENVLGAIFSIWKELRKAKSWEEVEETVWGDLNSYKGSY